MDDELFQLEAELKRLRPTAPSPRVEHGIAHQLASAATRSRPPRAYWIALPLAAAAIFAIAFGLAPRAPHTPAPTPHVARTPSAAQFKPVAAENILLNSRDEGVVTLQDGTTARRIRQTYVDKITWKNPKTNASLSWSLPREEVQIVPIALQ